MFYFPIIRTLVRTLLILAVLLSASAVLAVMDPRYEIDPQLMVGSITQSKSSKVMRKKVSAGRHTVRAQRPRSDGTSYTVKPGDHLFKILMRDFGLSNAEAELFIDEIRRENNIYDIKRLKIGQTITIPPVLRDGNGRLKLARAGRNVSERAAETAADARQAFTLPSPVAAPSEPEALQKLHGVWDKIVPPGNAQQKPLAFQTPTFSLRLDPARFPTFAGMNGGRIIVDSANTIPPLVKALIEEKDPGIRIVTARPLDSRYSLASLLAAAGFYSVEENLSLDFGVDPTLTVQADFKVEKRADSLINQDVVLINAARPVAPAVLGDFLKKEGFSLYEPFGTLQQSAGHLPRSLYQVTSLQQPEILDTILKILAVNPLRDHQLEVFAAQTNGISLSVKAERYFEQGGKRYVITHFDGDPVTYTLFRILETMDYRVVILEPADDFRKVTEKVVSHMRIPGTYERHSLPLDGSAGYAITLSGFSLDDPAGTGHGLFITDRPLDKIIRDLLTINGYSINNR